MKIQFRYSWAFVFLVLLCSSCSTTRVVNSWSGPIPHENVKHVYIVALGLDKVLRGVSEQEKFSRFVGVNRARLARLLFEQTYQQRLYSEGVKSTLSSEYWSGDSPQNWTEHLPIVQEHNCDAVIFTKLRDIYTRSKFISRNSAHIAPRTLPTDNYDYTRYPSDSVRKWNMTSGRIVSSESSPGFASRELAFETSIYDVKSEILIWTADIEVVLQKDLESTLNLFVERVVNELKKDKVLVAMNE